VGQGIELKLKPGKELFIVIPQAEAEGSAG
jgi:hypothetical protein